MGGAGAAAKKPQQAKGLAATLALLRNTGRQTDRQTAGTAALGPLVSPRGWLWVCVWV